MTPRFLSSQHSLCPPGAAQGREPPGEAGAGLRSGPFCAQAFRATAARACAGPAGHRLRQAQAPQPQPPYSEAAEYPRARWRVSVPPAGPISEQPALRGLDQQARAPPGRAVLAEGSRPGPCRRSWFLSVSSKDSRRRAGPEGRGRRRPDTAAHSWDTLSRPPAPPRAGSPGQWPVLRVAGGATWAPTRPWLWGAPRPQA